MWDRMEAMKARYEELGEKLSDPEVLADPKRLETFGRAHAELAEVVSLYEAYQSACTELDGVREMLGDDLEPEMQEMAEAERERLTNERDRLESEIRYRLIPKDPNDDRSVVLEIRAGTGGEEAALFAADLFRMYNRYAEAQGWRVELLQSNATELGGFKEVIAMVHGKGAFSRLKFESGVHRVQRIPETEAGGRIHTSTATVAVLAEAEEVEVQIDPGDLRIDVYRSSGPGGQSVNTTDSAVRITHLPTGTVVSCQDEKSQHKNKDKAMRIMRARLLDALTRAQADEISEARRSQVGSGDRSERIRTYNFPQGRMTDHRIGLTLYRLNEILAGELDLVIEPLHSADETARLQAMNA